VGVSGSFLKKFLEMVKRAIVSVSFRRSEAVKCRQGARFAAAQNSLREHPKSPRLVVKYPMRRLPAEFRRRRFTRIARGAAMFSVVILICSLSMSPGECHDYNALQTLSGGEARTWAACGFQAQEALARSAIQPTPEREYAKIECAPRKRSHI
jgi:hypothetical protein